MSNKKANTGRREPLVLDGAPSTPKSAFAAEIVEFLMADRAERDADIVKFHKADQAERNNVEAAERGYAPAR